MFFTLSKIFDQLWSVFDVLDVPFSQRLMGPTTHGLQFVKPGNAFAEELAVPIPWASILRVHPRIPSIGEIGCY